MKRVIFILAILFAVVISTSAQCVAQNMSGPTSVEDGYIETYVCDNTAGINYDWNVTGGDIVSGGGAGDHTATIAWEEPGEQSISVEIAAGADASYCVDVKPKPLNITGPYVVVSTWSYAYRGVRSPYDIEAYSWTITGSGSIDSGSSSRQCWATGVGDETTFTLWLQIKVAGLWSSKKG